MTTIGTKIVQVDWSQGDPIVTEVSNFPDTAVALAGLANTFNPQQATQLSREDIEGWRNYCSDAGKYALGQLGPNQGPPLAGWSNQTIEEESTSNGNGTGWDPQLGGVARAVAYTGAPDLDLWAEFFPATTEVIASPILARRVLPPDPAQADGEQVPALDLRVANFQLCNDTGQTVYGVVLEFMFGRCDIVKIEVDQGLVFFRTPFAVGITFGRDRVESPFNAQKSLPPNGTKLVTITYRLDPPAFRITPPPATQLRRFVTWLATKGAPLTGSPDPFARLASPLRFDGSPAAERAVADYVSRHEPSARALRKRRLADIQASKGAVKTYKQFFLDLDFATNPALGADAGTIGTKYFQLKHLLQYRFLRRAHAVALGQLTWPTYASTLFSSLSLALVRVDAAHAAAELQSLISKHFKQTVREGPRGSFEESFEEALELFAAGALTAFDGHGGPDGPLLFTLGEFVLLLRDLVMTPTIHNGKAYRSKAPAIDWNFWYPLVPVMCRVSEIFARCYHRPGSPEVRRFAAYSPGYNPNGRRGKGSGTAAFLAAVRRAWAGRPPESEFAHTVASALRDELSTKGWRPKPLPDHLPNLAGATKCANAFAASLRGGSAGRRPARKA